MNKVECDQVFNELSRDKSGQKSYLFRSKSCLEMGYKYEANSTFGSSSLNKGISGLLFRLFKISFKSSGEKERSYFCQMRFPFTSKDCSEYDE